MTASHQQLGFGFDEMLHEQDVAHLPSTMEEAIPYYRGMIDKHHAAMLAGDEKAAMAVTEEAHQLAEKLNGGTMLGILGGPDAPGCVLERETAAPVGTVPRWGQEGDFTITVGNTPVRITMDGMFGICAMGSVWPGFAAHVVDRAKPFPVSNTGYRGFMGVHADMVPGLTPDEFVKRVIEAHIAKEQKPERKGRHR